MQYTMSAPLNVFVRKSTSCMVPIAAFAPRDSISFLRPALLLMTVTSCPFFTDDSVSGLLILPKEPVITIFISLFFDDTNVCSIKKTIVAESILVVGKKMVLNQDHILT